MGRIHVIGNPQARRGRRDLSAVVDHLEGRDHEVVLVVADGPERVASAIADRSDEIERLIMVGGDGLLHHLLPALAETSLVLGIVPSGTGNDFARALGLPSRRRAAVDRALGPAAPVDLLRVVGPGGGDGASRWVATVLTTGFSGRVNDRANGLRFPRGQQKYTVATLAEVRRLRPVDVSLTLDGAEVGGSTTLVAVANTRYFGGGMEICPTADPDDGRLHVTVIEAVGAPMLLAVLPLVFIGQHVRHPSVRQAVGTVVELDSSEALWADGEPLGSGPVEVQVVPGALHVAGVGANGSGRASTVSA